jgi:hypothetical protein
MERDKSLDRDRAYRRLQRREISRDPRFDDDSRLDPGQRRQRGLSMEKPDEYLRVRPNIAPRNRRSLPELAIRR